MHIKKMVLHCLAGKGPTNFSQEQHALWPTSPRSTLVV